MWKFSSTLKKIILTYKFLGRNYMNLISTRDEAWTFKFQSIAKNIVVIISNCIYWSSAGPSAVEEDVGGEETWVFAPQPLQRGDRL